MTYDDSDDDSPDNIPAFLPTNGQVGMNLPDDFVPSSKSDFFKLYFSETIVDAIAQFTNIYAHAHIHQRPEYRRFSDGQWQDTTRAEIYNLIALLLFQGINKLPEAKDYWCTSSLFSSNYARLMIPSYKRYKALLSNLKVVDSATEDPRDQL